MFNTHPPSPADARGLTAKLYCIMLIAFTHIVSGILSPALKRAFVLSSLVSRLKCVTLTEDEATFIKLNEMFKLTDGTASLEFPTKILASRIWNQSQIDALNIEMASGHPNIRAVSRRLADDVPFWLRYADGKELMAMEIERVIKSHTALNF